MADLNQPKRCPFLNQECIGQDCALSIEVVRQKQVLNKVFTEKLNLCSFVALCDIMSSRQQQAVPTRLPAIKPN